MRLSTATMYGRLLASDPAYDGSFFTGVLTTGIYCLPSCRARKPLAKNVRFFPSCKAARAHGLRACKKCHPDDYENGVDPVMETIESVVNELRLDPASFPDAATLIRRSGYGPTRAHELFRLHFHATPAELIASARFDHAHAKLISTEKSISEIAMDSGYESMSNFHDSFRWRTGLTPGIIRSVPTLDTLRMVLPENYPVGHFLAAVGRDRESLSEQVDGMTLRMAMRLPNDQPSLLRLDFSEPNIALLDTSAVPSGPARSATVISASRMLGLSQDAAGFARLAEKISLERLVKGRESLRLVQNPNPWDTLVWAILGQQINLPFAYRLRNVLTEIAGEKVGGDLTATPSPSAVASIPMKTLLARQFSRQKAGYLIDVARLVSNGELDLTSMFHWSASRVARTLGAVRGLGPWTVNYVMMRGFGFADCTPYGDTGLTSGLQRLLNLKERPDSDETRRLMLPFSPYRSLATAHLWQI